MAEHAKPVRAPAAPAAPVGPDAVAADARHAGLERRSPVQADVDRGRMLNRRPAVVAQRRAAERLVDSRSAPQPRASSPTGLPGKLKAGVENLSGVSMEGVKVHYDSAKPAALNALAYTQGSDIHVAPGQERHLPHEAWHVVQQAQGRVKPTLQMKDEAVNDEAGLESEADAMGARALAGGAGGGPVPLPAAGGRRSGGGAPIQPKVADGGEAALAQLVPAGTESDVVQLRLAPLAPATVLTRMEKEWNDFLDFAATLPAALKTPVDNFARDNERSMRLDFNDQVTALSGIRNTILDGLDGARIEEDSQAQIDWDEIWDFVSGDLVASDLVATTQTAGLGGGHGNAGFRWTVKRARDNQQLAMGSVPNANNQHGRTVRALNGTRGTVRTAIRGLNDEIAYYRALAEVLPYT
jgi:hypothetical protein